MEPKYLAKLCETKDISRYLQPTILGGDILGYTFSRLFAESYGIRSVILSGVDVKVTSSSRFVEYNVLEGMQDEDTVIEHLLRVGKELEEKEKVGLLLGSADWHARIISSHMDELSAYYVVPYIPLTIMDEVTNKRRFYELCEELDIAYPKTWYVNVFEGTDHINLDDFVYPCILKPSLSSAWDNLDFAGKKKVYELKSKEELQEALGFIAAAKYEHDLIIQDFIPGADDAIFSLTTFSDKYGQMQLVSGGRVVLQDHSPAKLGNPVTIASERVDVVIEAASRFLSRTGYVGYANFDIKFDERDGSYRFFEVNARCGRNSYYVSLGGVNLIEPIVKYWVLGEELEYKEAFEDFVYTLVPKKVIEKSIQDPVLRGRVLAAYDTGLAQSPLDAPKDSLKHEFWWRLYYYHQIKNFKRNLWDKTK